MAWEQPERWRLNEPGLVQSLVEPMAQQYGDLPVRPSQVCPGPHGTWRLSRETGLARLKGARAPRARTVKNEKSMLFEV